MVPWDVSHPLISSLKLEQAALQLLKYEPEMLAGADAEQKTREKSPTAALRRPMWKSGRRWPPPSSGCCTTRRAPRAARLGWRRNGPSTVQDVMNLTATLRLSGRNAHDGAKTHQLS